MKSIFALVESDAKCANCKAGATFVIIDVREFPGMPGKSASASADGKVQAVADVRQFIKLTHVCATHKDKAFN